jgi:hypothetical protein
MSRRELAAFGAVAFLACCATPLLLGVIGGIGVLGLVSSLFIGVAGLVIAVVAVLALVVLRRRTASPQNLERESSR